MRNPVLFIDSHLDVSYLDTDEIHIGHPCITFSCSNSSYKCTFLTFMDGERSFQNYDYFCA